MTRNRNLDGIYMRVLRGGQYQNVCLSDMTESERTALLSGKSAQWLLGAVNHLAAKLREVGDFCDVEAVDD